MPPPNHQDRLSRISTTWTLVRQAHGGPSSGLSDAQQRLFERYAGAVLRYLQAALRDTEAADDLFQEFSLRLLRGDFKNANPERGQFRFFLKTCVYHLIVDYQKRRKLLPLDSGVVEPAVEPPSTVESDKQFLACCREELLDRAWLALEQFEQQSGQPYHTVLRFRTEQPLLSAKDMATQLGQRLVKTYSIDAIRQTLHRSREKFAELLLREVAAGIGSPSREELEQELIELELYGYCKGAIGRVG